MWLLSPDFTLLAHARVLTWLTCGSNYGRNIVPFLVLHMNEENATREDGLLYGNDDGDGISTDIVVDSLHVCACFSARGCLPECTDWV